MKQLGIAILLAAGTILAGCKSNESKPEEAAPPPQATAAPAPAPVAAKPECAPEPVTKKKTTKKTAKKAEAAPVDCEPAKPKTATTAKAAEPAAPAPAKEAAKPAEAGKPRMMKSRDGTFEGEVYGNIPAGSKWSKLQIGMHQSEVERILGTTSNIRGYVTAKAWIPFYFGNDSHRYEAVYPGQGSVAYTGGGMGGGQGTLMMINYDPAIQ
jgi:type IV secretory pathway VirB10-like protein